jgi:uncharacterized coiled-coil DUF342 family protein
MNEINELRNELKEVVKEMRAGHMTQVEILMELRGLKPRVEKLEADNEQLKMFTYKTLGVLTLVSFLGAPTVAGILVYMAK